MEEYAVRKQKDWPMKGRERSGWLWKNMLSENRMAGGGERKGAVGCGGICCQRTNGKTG